MPGLSTHRRRDRPSATSQATNKIKLDLTDQTQITNTTVKKSFLRSYTLDKIGSYLSSE